MKVGIMYSGGKDSTFAVDFAMEKGWKIEWLLSVKPTRNDCYLFHFATVEHTPKIAEILGLNHKLISCDIADPVLEAELVKNAVQEIPKVDMILLGGTGLQETQIRSLQNAMRPLGIDVGAAHAGLEHDDVMKQMLAKGYRFVISQIAAEGLTKEWLGRELTPEAMQELIVRSQKYGFHCGGEGGHYDTLCFDGPVFNKILELSDKRMIMESPCQGHLECTATIVAKAVIHQLD